MAVKEFKTESKKLLDLMINSIYTNREIFLREIISNASDAIDKLVFKGLTDPSLQVNRAGLGIEVAFDKDARTITVTDNGIGMSAEELDRNLGTIAHSGSEQFKKDLAAQEQAAKDGDAKATDEDTEVSEAEEAKPVGGKEVDVIGQFGVGFYSSFMVAEKVRVVSRAFGSDTANAWESDGLNGYEVTPAAAGELDGPDDHGTIVTLHLRPSTADDTPTSC